MGIPYSTTDIAERYEVDERTVYRWRKEGLPWDDGVDSKVLLDWYVEREIARRLSKTSTGEVLDLDGERARLSKEQADQKAMENAQRRGSLVDVEVVASTWEKIAGNTRNRLLAIPSEAAPLLVGIDAPGKIKGVLDGMIHECLLDLAAAGDHAGGVKVLRAPQAPAKADRQPVGRRKPKAKSRK